MYGYIEEWKTTGSIAKKNPYKYPPGFPTKDDSSSFDSSTTPSVQSYILEEKEKNVSSNTTFPLSGIKKDCFDREIKFIHIFVGVTEEKIRKKITKEKENNENDIWISTFQMIASDKEKTNQFILDNPNIKIMLHKYLKNFI